MQARIVSQLRRKVMKKKRELFKKSKFASDVSGRSTVQRIVRHSSVVLYVVGVITQLCAVNITVFRGEVSLR